MATTKVKFETADANLKTATKTFGYVNPESSDYTLKSLVTGAYALSKNTVRTIQRIDTRDITNATEGEVTPVTPAAGGKSVSFTSSSDFFSTDVSTFHTFLQNAHNAYTGTTVNAASVLTFEIADGTLDGEDPNAIAATITYGDLETLLQNNSATIQDFASLINDKIEDEGGIGVTASYNKTNGLTFTNTNGTADSDTVSVKVTEGAAYGSENAGHLILESMYNGANDKSVFSTKTNQYNGTNPYTQYTLTLVSE